jgi:hypothetical protein
MSLLLLFPPSPISGSGGATFTGFLTESGNGNEIFTGSGDLQPWSLQLAGSGQETFTGSGDASFAFLQLAGSGTETFTGSGDASFTFTESGSGAETFTGSGDATFTFSVAGSGQETESGSGDWSFSASASGSGNQTFGGSGGSSLNFSESGTGQEIFAGSGDLQPVTLVFSGSDASGATGAGGLSLAGPTYSGLGDILDGARGSILAERYPERSLGFREPPARIGGYGAPRFDEHTSSGSGSVIDPISGCGALRIHPLIAAGIGGVIDPVSGSGDVRFTLPAVAGMAALEFNSAGTLIVPTHIARGSATYWLPPWLDGEDDMLLGLFAEDELELIA